MKEQHTLSLNHGYGQRRTCPHCLLLGPRVCHLLRSAVSVQGYDICQKLCVSNLCSKFEALSPQGRLLICPCSLGSGLMRQAFVLVPDIHFHHFYIVWSYVSAQSPISHCRTNQKNCIRPGRNQFATPQRLLHPAFQGELLTFGHARDGGPWTIQRPCSKAGFYRADRTLQSSLAPR
jgi:hypothetical protein